jgi:hypothetical protein
MPLFILDDSFREEEAVNPQGEPFRHVEICLRVAITEPTASGPPDPPHLLEFVLDTGGDCATVTCDHLADSGISLAGPSGGWISVAWSDGRSTLEQTRDVTLWLYSNLPEWKDKPYRIELNGGVIVLTRTKSEMRPLFGMNPLLESGLRIELNAQARKVSVWIPD